MQTSHFKALRRRFLPLAALATAAAGLGGCVATAPAPAYYGYNSPAYVYSSPAPQPYYNNGATVTYSNGAVAPATYPLVLAVLPRCRHGAKRKRPRLEHSQDD